MNNTTVKYKRDCFDIEKKIKLSQTFNKIKSIHLSVAS